MQRSKRQYSGEPLNLEQGLEGIVVISISAQDVQPVLQLLSQAKISVFHLASEKNKFYFSIYLDDFTAMKRLLRNHQVRFRISGKRGMPFLISRIKRKKGILVGLFCSILLGHFLLSFLWTYEVDGNERYTDAQIISLVQQYGMWPGTMLEHLDYEALEHEIELDHPEFTWVQLEPRGTTLCISVKERLLGEAPDETTGSIVAKCDGMITELLLYRGTALVACGDLVSAGQVLIGGWEYPDRVRNDMGIFVNVGEPYAVRASGVIRGNIEREAIGTCALEETWLQKNGQEEVCWAILFREHTLGSIGKKQSPYTYSETVVEQHSLFRWGSWQCPVVLKKTIYQEQTKMSRGFTEEEAYRIAIERARKQLQLMLPQNATMVDERMGILRSAQSGAVQVKVVWVTEEPLGQMMDVVLPAS